MPRRHGFKSTYVNGGCRCPACRQAHSEYQTVRRERQRLALHRPDHGRLKRCPVCERLYYALGSHVVRLHP